MRTGTRDVLAVITAARRLDLRLVSEAVGDSHIRLATEEELSRDVEGYELGALLSLGALAATTCIDPEVLRRDSGGCGWRAGGELFGEMGGTHRGLGAFSLRQQASRGSEGSLPWKLRARSLRRRVGHVRPASP